MMEDYQQTLFERIDTSLSFDRNMLPASNRIKNEIQVLVDSTGQKYLLENSFDEISTIYKLVDGNKEKLFAMGRTTDPYLVLRDGHIYFTNREVHARWTNREYGDIYQYDIKADKVNRITNGKKYLSVDYQPHSGRFLAVQAGFIASTCHKVIS